MLGKITPLSLLVIFATACASTDPFVKPIEEFRAASVETAAVTHAYLTELNARERDFNFATALTDPSIAIQESDERYFFNSYFSPDGVEARVDALLVIDRYVALLASIARSGSDGDTLDAGIAALSAGISGLAERFQTIGSDQSRPPGERETQNYVGPISTLVALIGQNWHEHERMRMLEMAVESGAPAVEKILSLLEEDLSTAYYARTEVIVGKYNALRLDYNSNRFRIEYTERQNRLAELRALADIYETLQRTQIQHLIADMRRAHNALVEAIRNAGEISSYEAFVATLEVFADRAARAVAATRALAD